MRGAILILALALWSAASLPGAARSGAAGAVLPALQAAEARLKEARTSIGQRRALGEAIRAYETAIQALGADIAAVRAELRIRERAIGDGGAALRTLAGGLARVGLGAAPMVEAGAANPVDGVRAALLIERAAGAARARLEALEAERSALAALAAQQQEALQRMAETQARLREIRDELIEEADESRAAAAALPDIGPDTENLAALAVALESSVPGDAEAVPLAPGALALPVSGASLLRMFGDKDAAGIVRPGIALAAAPGALVSAPSDSSVRFTGALDGYGETVILEPALGTVLVLSGLERILVTAGELVGAGAPLGFLPGTPSHEEFLRGSGEETGQPGFKTLYMELRHDRQPVDPLPWFTGLR